MDSLTTNKMKIEIQNNDPSGSFGYEIIDLNNRRHIHNNKSMFTRFFDDEDILNILGDKKYRQFEAGKYEFEVTKKQIFDISNDLNYFIQPK